MTTVEIIDVLPDSEGVWCRVLGRQGVLSLGQRLDTVHRGDGSTVAVSLVVAAIQGPTGPQPRLEAYAMGSVRLTGEGADLLQPGCALEGATARTGTFAPPAWTSAPGATVPLTESDPPYLVVDEAQHLSRLTTAFRLLLLIPQYVVLYVLNIAVEVVLVIGWFAALVMGRLPDWTAEFLANCLKYQTRVLGYGVLLTDRYPPFGFTAPTYPVRVDLPPPGRLNRWSVFFRLLLMLPVALVSGVVMTGWWVASVVVWLVVLVLGRFPAALFRASVAALRFQLRVSAYGYLLTSRYPRGLYGDDQPRDDRRELVLSRAAKGLVTLFLVLGLIGVGGYTAGIVLAGEHTASKQQALDDVRASYRSMRLSDLAAQLTGCQSDADQLTCVETYEELMADRLDAFRATVDGMNHPSGTGDDFDRLSQRTKAFSQSLHHLAHATSVADYQAIAAHEQSSQLGAGVDDAYNALVKDLEN